MRNRLSDPTPDEFSQRATGDSSQERREPDRGLDRALDGRPHRRRRGRHMRTEFRRNSSAARDAQARAAQACAANAPTHKGRAARSALSLLNTHELTPFEDLPVAKQADSLARGTVRLRRSPITGGTASRRLSSSGSLRGVRRGARRHAYFHRPHFAEARTNHRFRCSIAAIVLTGRAAASDGGRIRPLPVRRRGRLLSTASITGMVRSPSRHAPRMRLATRRRPHCLGGITNVGTGPAEPQGLLDAQNVEPSQRLREKREPDRGRSDSQI
jgi:hypothetical protein